MVKHIFFLTSPHDEADRGDTDYVKTVIVSFAGDQNYHLEHVTGDTKHSDSNKLYDMTALYPTHYKENDNATRRRAVERVIEYIGGKGPKENRIIHLQLRAPETGCMFHTGDLGALKVLAEKFIVTCHEWSSVAGEHNKTQQIEYLKVANKVMLLNEAEQRNLISNSSDGLKLPESIETLVSNVIPTLPTQLTWDATTCLSRPNNGILIFGLIREQKGFEEGIKLAEKVKRDDLRYTLTFAGKVQSIKLGNKIAGLIHNNFKLEDKDFRQFRLKEFLRTNGIESVATFDNIWNSNMNITHKARAFADGRAEILGEIRDIISKSCPDEEKKRFFPKMWEEFMNAAPPVSDQRINVEFGCDAAKLDELANKHMYCVKFEKKEFANNSSSIINMLCRGLITFTRCGELTSTAFKNGGDYEGAVILRENFDVQRILEEIERRNNEKDMQTNHNTLARLALAKAQLFSCEAIKGHHMEIYK
jgi:hypothetical protein